MVQIVKQSSRLKNLQKTNLENKKTLERVFALVGGDEDSSMCEAYFSGGTE